MQRGTPGHSAEHVCQVLSPKWAPRLRGKGGRKNVRVGVQGRELWNTGSLGLTWLLLMISQQSWLLLEGLHKIGPISIPPQTGEGYPSLRTPWLLVVSRGGNVVIVPANDPICMLLKITTVKLSGTHTQRHKSRMRGTYWEEEVQWVWKEIRRG